MSYKVTWKFGGGTETQTFSDSTTAQLEAVHRSHAYMVEYGRCETVVEDEEGVIISTRVDDRA